MVNDTNFKNRVKDLLALCQRANSLLVHYGSDSQKAADLAFWTALQALDKEAALGGPGWARIGRVVKFGVADGYARYIITGVTKHTCKVIHIPYGDAYHSPEVNRSSMEVDRVKVERILSWEDGMAAEVENQRRKRQAVVNALPEVRDNLLQAMLADRA